MKILATPQLVDVHLRLLRSGRIKPAGIQSGKRLGMTLEDMEAAADRVRERRASLAMQVPREHGIYDDETPQAPGVPTKQWQAKAGANMASQSIGRGEVVPLKRYRIKHVVEQHGDKFDMSKRSALERFMQDSTYAIRIKAVDLNASGGGGAPGSKLGGLGNVPQHIRDGHTRHEWVWSRLSPEMQATANALVTRELAKPDGTPFSLEDFGAQMFPGVRDKNRLWGAAAGALWSLAGGLVFLYGRCPTKVRPIGVDDEVGQVMELTR